MGEFSATKICTLVFAHLSFRLLEILMEMGIRTSLSDRIRAFANRQPEPAFGNHQPERTYASKRRAHLHPTPQCCI